MATKQAIKTYVLEHYKDLIEVFDNPDCITIRSIEGAITRARDKLNLPAKRDFLKDLLPKEDADTSSLDSSNEGDTTKDGQETVLEGTGQEVG